MEEKVGRSATNGTAGESLHFCLWRKLRFGSVQPSPATDHLTIVLMSGICTANRTAGDSFAFLPLAKIKVPLRPAAAGNAYPRCI